MTILQACNFGNHLQFPFAEAILNHIPIDCFTYAELVRPSEERIRLGWETTTSRLSLIRPFESEMQELAFLKKIDSSDVLLIGERRLDLVARRLRARKLTIYMSERWWKPPLGRTRLLSPRFLLMTLRMRSLSRSKYFHYLPIGHHAERDLRYLFCCGDRTRRWGYFPNCYFPRNQRPRGVTRILWVGRLLNWKRVDVLIEASRILRKRGRLLELSIVGEGPERGRIGQLVRSSPWIQLLPPRPHREILTLMSQSHIYVLPSTAQEGWGAVVNEAMAAGCVVFASKESGAGEALINNGKNGFHIGSETGEALANLLESGLQGFEETSIIRNKAMDTIRNLWNADIAAERFCLYCDSILQGRAPQNWDEGPLSKIK